MSAAGKGWTGEGVMWLGGGGGANVGGGGWGVVGGQPLRTALHTISISLQNSFCESHTWRLVRRKALREVNARWALPVYPVFEDETANVSDKTSFLRIIALKTWLKQLLLWEQLNIVTITIKRKECGSEHLIPQQVFHQIVTNYSLSLTTYLTK